jgi:predicted RNase H-like nuclease (RuvC/YqgF family)
MNECIFGTDIIRGSVRSRTLQSRYALVRIGNETLFSEKNVTQFQLMRCIRIEQPEIVAVDCIQEIVQGITCLHAFFAELPVGTNVAARYNLSFDKLNLMEEAKMSALLASFGAGYEVLAYTDVTDFIISRNHSPGCGRWSQNRYVRKMHGVIRAPARDIEMKLVSANHKYSMMTHRAFGGENRVISTVDVPREHVPISSLKGGGVQIRIVGHERDEISLQPLKKISRDLIVGIDPGTTVGIVTLDLDGNLVYLASTRFSSAAVLIREIANLGKQLVVASDKSEMPFGVENIRRAFSASSWIPMKSILIKEKCVLATNFDFKNDHERDSFSAAVYASRTCKNRFESILKRAPVGTDVDELRAQIVREFSLELALSPINETVPVAQTLTEPNESSEIIFDERDEQITRREETIQRRRTLVGMLFRESSEKDKIISTPRRKLNVERAKQHTELLVRIEIAERDRKIVVVKKQLKKEERKYKNLQLQPDRMKRYIALQTGGKYSAFKVLPQFLRDTSRKLGDEMGFGEEDLLYVLRIDEWGRNVVRELVEARVKAVLLPEHVYARAREQHLIEVFRDAGLPVFSSANFEEAPPSWVASQTEYSKEKNADIIDAMVKEYHVERARGVRELEVDPTHPSPNGISEFPQIQERKKVAKVIIREFSGKKRLINFLRHMNLYQNSRSLKKKQIY